MNVSDILEIIGRREERLIGFKKNVN